MCKRWGKHALGGMDGGWFRRSRMSIHSMVFGKLRESSCAASLERAIK